MGRPTYALVCKVSDPGYCRLPSWKDEVTSMRWTDQGLGPVVYKDCTHSQNEFGKVLEASPAFYA